MPRCKRGNAHLFWMASIGFLFAILMTGRSAERKLVIKDTPKSKRNTRMLGDMIAKPIPSFMMELLTRLDARMTQIEDKTKLMTEMMKASE